ncbi:alkaline phosphatase PhoX [Sorangium sp. So ce381]|uniref:alkaline phosphatase PhoX n=1 Tax=Sorangium sp. So ce381 TaxID=3133307 RepID=UPI003F5C9309
MCPDQRARRLDLSACVALRSSRASAPRRPCGNRPVPFAWWCSDVDHPHATTRPPDNITIAPWGELFMAEDGYRGNYPRGVTLDGQIFDFARNARA